MTQPTHCQLRILIDEMSAAYTVYDYASGDYAGFASMAIHEFQTALGRPDLSPAQLRKLLREGHTLHRAAAAPQNTWASFMASYVSGEIGNGNTAIGVTVFEGEGI